MVPSPLHKAARVASLVLALSTGVGVALRPSVTPGRGGDSHRGFGVWAFARGNPGKAQERAAGRGTREEDIPKCAEYEKHEFQQNKLLKGTEFKCSVSYRFGPCVKAEAEANGQMQNGKFPSKCDLYKMVDKMPYKGHGQLIWSTFLPHPPLIGFFREDPTPP